MVTLDIGLWASLLISFGVILFFLVIFLYECRDAKQASAQQKHRGVFHCNRCGQVYSLSALVERGRCSRCQFENYRLKF